MNMSALLVKCFLGFLYCGHGFQSSQWASRDNSNSNTDNRKTESRIAWFHPPNCATSFGSTVTHYANSSLPALERAPLLENWDVFWRKYPMKVWFQGDVIWLPPVDHAKVSADVYERFKGHFVGMFRSPASRAYSSWVDKGQGSGDFHQYSARINGMVTKMLAGQAGGGEWKCFNDETKKWVIWPETCGSNDCVGTDMEGPCQEPNLHLAIKRLREGFKFVGLVEHYALSVSLFHAKFGGDCLIEEFENMRPTLPAANYAAQHMPDNPDAALYAEAEWKFWSDIFQNNVTLEVCKNLCGPYHDYS